MWRKEGEAGAMRLACWAAEVAGLRELEELLSLGARATGIWRGGAKDSMEARGDREGEEIERRERASERRFLAALDGASRERARGSTGG